MREAGVGLRIADVALDQLGGGVGNRLVAEDNQVSSRRLWELAPPLEDLDDAMKEAFALKDRTVFLDVLIDRMEHVYPMHVAPNGSIKAIWLSKNERV